MLEGLDRCAGRAPPPRYILNTVLQCLGSKVPVPVPLQPGGSYTPNLASSELNLFMGGGQANTRAIMIGRGEGYYSSYIQSRRHRYCPSHASCLLLELATKSDDTVSPMITIGPDS